ncbi:hypothetical protein BGP_4389 [Beggiatoa sp. PS]|nr:hypothetical protein BGP_4389 [Beggiatoa sp. PS]
MSQTGENRLLPINYCRYLKSVSYLSIAQFLFLLWDLEKINPPYPTSQLPTLLTSVPSKGKEAEKPHRVVSSFLRDGD